MRGKENRGELMGGRSRERAYELVREREGWRGEKKEKHICVGGGIGRGDKAIENEISHWSTNEVRPPPLPQEIIIK